MERPELVAIGTVLRPHGIAGELRIRPLTDRPRERFGSLQRCLVVEPGGEGGVPWQVAGCRFERDGVLLRLAGIDSAESADRLVGSTLAVEAAEVLAPPPGHFYAWQLAGARVEARD